MEASAEIQAAARRVVEENRRLRQLLKQQGLSDADIDRITVDVTDSRAASDLEAMLGQKKRCGRGNCTPSSESRTLSLSTASPIEPPPQPDYAHPLHPTSTSMATTPSVSRPSPHSLQPDFKYPLPNSTPELNLPYNATLDWLDDQEISPDQLFPMSHSMPETTGSSSCHVAANAVRSLHPGLGHELERELGCGNGQECVIPNSYIFQVMDRYNNDR